MNLTDSKLTVAVVDDDMSMLRALARLIQTGGYAVKTYTSAAGFLADFVPATIDYLILDVQMPEMNGFEVAAALAQRGIPIPVLFITAHDSPWAREKATDAHARGFLVKPFNPKELLGAISDILPHSVAG